MHGERASPALEAPLALASLAAIYDHIGDTARANAARTKLDATYTMTSSWADSLRKRRNASGQPDEDALRKALAALPPALPAVPQAELQRLMTSQGACALWSPAACRQKRA